MAKKVMLIGAGGVAGVAAAKMAQNPGVFGELLIASRTEARCKAIKADIESRPWFASKGASTKITTRIVITAMPMHKPFRERWWEQQANPLPRYRLSSVMPKRIPLRSQ